MDAPLQGDTGGHTGAAPTIPRVASCPKVAGEVLADGLKQEMIAGEVLAADIPRCLSQENSSSLHNHKGIVVARCSPLHKHKCIVAGEVLADGLIRKKVGGKGLNGGITR